MTDEGGRRSRKPKSAVLLLGVALALAAVVAGCSSNDNGQNSLQPAGKNAQRIQDLFAPVFWIGAVVGVLVIGATIVFALKFRHRPGQDDNPKQIHGSTPLEIGWTIVPALILAVIAVPTVATIFTIAQEPKGEVLEARVVGKQWWWEVRYPEHDVVTSTEIHMIAGVPLDVRLSSDNVIHSFWIPELAGKQDVVPGRNHRITLYADEPGTYLGQCAEYCGLAHADMRMRVIVQTRADFDEWIRGQQRGPAQPWTGEVEELTATKFACTNCHVFDDSTKTSFGPNLTHLASRTTFAGGTLDLDRDNLVDWVLDAPSLVPMQSEDCRLPPPATCVGMPSFVDHTPPGGDYPVMTRAEAEEIADYLLAER